MLGKYELSSLVYFLKTAIINGSIFMFNYLRNLLQYGFQNEELLAR